MFYSYYKNDTIAQKFENYETIFLIKYIPGWPGGPGGPSYATASGPRSPLSPFGPTGPSGPINYISTKKYYKIKINFLLVQIIEATSLETKFYK